MKKFLIQTLNGQIKHDFCFHLIEAIHYQNWYQNDKVYEYVLSEDTDKIYEEYIPVGSLEYVFKHIELNHNLKRTSINPINIPLELQKEEYLKRKIWIKSKSEIILKEEMFIKSNTKYKGFTDIIKDSSILEDNEEYLVSEIIPIESEWRAFIQRNELVGLQNYLGDFKLFPDIKLIEKMIDSYKNSPLSYTIDVSVHSKDGTSLIEVHPFVSCGLYGFSNYKILPSMFIQGFNSLLLLK